jgi:hypothetical protein
MALKILLRSSWQTVNIGDIGHTPGALRVFESHLPEAEMTLWPSSVDRGVRERLLERWPQLRIVEGDIDSSGQPTTPEVAGAIRDADLYVHGSGPNLIAPHHLDAWRQTGKPYGFFGITMDPFAFGADGSWEGGTLEEYRQRIAHLPEGSMDENNRARLTDASFVFFRDTLSLAHAQRQVPGLDQAAFGPDAAFACDLRDDGPAEAWLAQHGLEPKKFICVLPRLRWTPYYKLHGRAANEGDLAKDAVNDRTRKSDHEGFRQLIIRWVREAGLKVLACPEMTYQIAVAKEELIDPLPEDVKRNVVWRDTYWLNDEATSIYRMAHTVVSLENHSPILALTQETPVIFVRQPTDTIKGQMWRDLGLGENFFEVEDASGEALWSRLALIHSDYAAAQEGARRFVANAGRKLKEMAETAGQSLTARL